MNDKARYQDWGILNYWFRAVDKYAPWVRKIHFITCGQVPEWLNLNHPKLHFVRHEDYIPKQWLPTFSSHPIELNLHRIDGLSEKFVYFNDDIFLNAQVKPEDFFVNGLPRECAALHPGLYGFNNTRMREIAHIACNDLLVILNWFQFGQSFKANIRKWLTFRYGAKALLKTMLCLPFWRFTGFHETHTANAFLKSTFIEIWDKERALLEQTSSHRFRGIGDVNQWLMKYWQIASGKFYPRDLSGIKGYVANDSPDEMVMDIKQKKYKILCFNDVAFYDSSRDEDFAAMTAKLRQAYSEVLPEKSAFEV